MRLAIALLVLGVLARPAGAGEPDREWWTIETEHFVIHYYEPLEATARRVAVVAERSHEVLAPALGKIPDKKTQVVLYDDTDSANGFASVLPRNRITLYLTSPIGESALNDHEDWLYGLFAHEYTHILHLDSIGGLPKLVNRVLGKTWSPNQIMPRWIIEGLATYEETKRSSTGRARSAQFDMFVRASVLEHEQIDLDAVTNGPYEFPRGNAAYLYGGKFLQYVFDRFGDDAAREMSWNGGEHAIPYAVNRQIHEVTGVTFDELYDDWSSWLRDKYTTQLEAVERAGLREGRRLTFDTEGHISPQYSPDGKRLYWLASDGVSESRIRWMPVGGNIADAESVVYSDRFGGWAVLSDHSLVYEQTWNYRREYDYQDLFYRDGVTGDIQRLTRGLRARDPAVAHDGKRVAFYVNSASHSKLAVMPLVPGAEHEIVYEGEVRDNVYQPSWSPDDTRLAFSIREGAQRDLAIVDLATGELTRITDDRAIDGDPVWSPDGNTIYFSSDRTGIYNIYAHDLDTGAVWQVTNVIGGAFDPAVSPDGTRIAYHGFDASGYDLFEIAVDRDDWTVARPYVDDRPPPVEILADESAVPAPRKYRAIETLAPQSFTAELNSASSLGTAITLRTGGGDVAGLHAWNLAATVGLDEGDVNVGTSYSYGGLRMPLRFSAGRSIAKRNGYRVNDVSLPYKEESMSATVAFGVPSMRSPGGSLTLSGDVDADYRRLVETPVYVENPGDVVTRVPLSDYLQVGLALRAGWQNTRGHAETLGQVEGQELSASIRYDDPAFGATYRTFNLSWNYRRYQRLPWGTTPVLSLRYAGGVQLGDLDRGDAFALGGTPNQDVVDSIVGTARVSGQGYLHGYESRAVTGDAYQLVNLEYRQRLWVIEKGLSTLPIYLRRLHIAVLGDAGAAYDGEISTDDLRLSAGGALRLDAIFGWFAPGSFEIGYAHGFHTEGIDETWLLLTTTL